MIGEELLRELEQYIQNQLSMEEVLFNYEAPKYYDIESDLNMEIELFLDTRKEPTVTELLFRMIDEKGMYDVDVYKRAGLDRRHFSKIRSNPAYKMSKSTALSLAIAMELDVDETETLLNAAGFSLSYSDRSDLVIQFFIEKQIYDFQVINEALDYFSLKPIGGV